MKHILKEVEMKTDHLQLLTMSLIKTKTKTKNLNSCSGTRGNLEICENKLLSILLGLFHTNKIH